MGKNKNSLRIRDKKSGKCCFSCKHHVFKMMMNMHFETGHRCNGVCGNKNNDIYYTALEFVFDAYEIAWLDERGWVHCMGVFDMDDVKAWMPLPPRYEGKENV
jgi:hypothetical protein